MSNFAIAHFDFALKEIYLYNFQVFVFLYRKRQFIQMSIDGKQFL